MLSNRVEIKLSLSNPSQKQVLCRQTQVGNKVASSFPSNNSTLYYHFQEKSTTDPSIDTTTTADPGTDNTQDDQPTPVAVALPPPVEVIDESIIQMRRDLFMCAVCLKTTTTRQALRRHVRRTHVQSYPGFKCRACHKVFSTYPLLRTHETFCTVIKKSRDVMTDKAKKQRQALKAERKSRLAAASKQMKVKALFEKWKSQKESKTPEAVFPVEISRTVHDVESGSYSSNIQEPGSAKKAASRPTSSAASVSKCRKTFYEKSEKKSKDTEKSKDTDNSEGVDDQEHDMIAKVGKHIIKSGNISICSLCQFKSSWRSSVTRHIYLKHLGWTDSTFNGMRSRQKKARMDAKKKKRTNPIMKASKKIEEDHSYRVLIDKPNDPTPQQKPKESPVDLTPIKKESFSFGSVFEENEDVIKMKMNPKVSRVKHRKSTAAQRPALAGPLEKPTESKLSKTTTVKDSAIPASGKESLKNLLLGTDIKSPIVIPSRLGAGSSKTPAAKGTPPAQISLLKPSILGMGKTPAISKPIASSQPAAVVLTIPTGSEPSSIAASQSASVPMLIYLDTDTIESSLVKPQVQGTPVIAGSTKTKLTKEQPSQGVTKKPIKKTAALSEKPQGPTLTSTKMIFEKTSKDATSVKILSVQQSEGMTVREVGTSSTSSIAGASQQSSKGSFKVASIEASNLDEGAPIQVIEIDSEEETEAESASSQAAQKSMKETDQSTDQSDKATSKSNESEFKSVERASESVESASTSIERE